MESASLRRVPALPSAVQLGLIFGLLLLAAIAWAVTDDRMGGMDAGPATDPGSLGFWVTTWVVMMAAMMFPSIAPMVVMHARIEEGKRRQGKETGVGTTTMFVSGYLLTWTAAGLVGYGVIEAGQALSLDVLAWDRAGPYVAGGVIAAAAIYQLTPLKDACLHRCRSPMMLLLTAWRPGQMGGLEMGIEHGAWCVGCCWALMAALFALGVMSIGWMALIAALIATEKLLPWKAVANRSIAVLLVVLALGVAVSPEDVPGLTEPGSAEAQAAMEAMGMEGGSMEEESMEEGSGGAMDEQSMDEEMQGAPAVTGESMDDETKPARGGEMKEGMQP
jgi:predicted metal-binding membrane protein